MSGIGADLLEDCSMHMECTGGDVDRDCVSGVHLKRKCVGFPGWDFYRSVPVTIAHAKGIKTPCHAEKVIAGVW